MASTWSFSSVVVGAGVVLVLVVIMALGLTLSLGLSAAEPQAESRVLTGLYQPLTAWSTARDCDGSKTDTSSSNSSKEIDKTNEGADWPPIVITFAARINASKQRESKLKTEPKKSRTRHSLATTFPLKLRGIAHLPTSQCPRAYIYRKYLGRFSPLLNSAVIVVSSFTFNFQFITASC